MRIRSLKPEAFQSETLSEVSIAAERTFFGLSTYADDRGRAVDKPAVINGALWPLRPEHTTADLDADLDALARAGLVCRYDGCDGRRYVHMVTWDEHQRVDRPSKSRIPPCGKHQGGEPCYKHGDDCPGGTPRTVPEEWQVSESPAPEDAQVERLASPREPSMQDLGPRTVDRGPRTVDHSSSEIAPRSSDAALDRPEVDRLCEHLADRIAANGSKRPKITKKWRDAVRLMLDRDGRTAQEVQGAIDWSQRDEFWRGVVLSAPKLREKFDQMRLAAQREQARASPGQRPSTTEQRAGAGLALAERLRAEEAAQ